MLTNEEVEKFANWAIEQEKKMIAERYPISEAEQKELDKLSHAEILEKLGVEI